MPHSHIIQIVVVGAGAFGKNHIRVYRELQAAGHPVCLAAIIEPSAAQAQAIVAAGWAYAWSSNTVPDGPTTASANPAEPPKPPGISAAAALTSGSANLSEPANPAAQISPASSAISTALSNLAAPANPTTPPALATLAYQVAPANPSASINQAPINPAASANPTPPSSPATSKDSAADASLSELANPSEPADPAARISPATSANFIALAYMVAPANPTAFQALAELANQAPLNSPELANPTPPSSPTASPNTAAPTTPSELESLDTRSSVTTSDISSFPEGAQSQAATAPPVPIFRSLEECLAQLTSGALHLDAASVCVPTSAHFEVASALIAAGLHVLIEKPIAATLQQADELIRLGRQHNRLIQVGHLERFNPAVAALASRINRPMFFEAHRLSIFSPRALDVDVVLDLMIHDLDIVLQLAHSPVREVHAVGLPILSPKVDIANVRVEFESGCVANFTASRVSTERVRKLRFFQPHQYVSVDYARQDLLIISVNKTDNAAKTAKPSDPDEAVPSAKPAEQVPGMSSASHAAAPDSPAPDSPAFAFPAPESAAPSRSPVQEIAHEPAAAPNTASPTPGLSFEKPKITQGEPLRLEIEAFLAAIHGDRPLAVPAEQGRAALALALQVQAAMEAHSTRANLSDLY